MLTDPKETQEACSLSRDESWLQLPKMWSVGLVSGQGRSAELILCEDDRFYNNTFVKCHIPLEHILSAELSGNNLLILDDLLKVNRER